MYYNAGIYASTFFLADKNWDVWQDYWGCIGVTYSALDLRMNRPQIMTHMATTDQQLVTSNHPTTISHYQTLIATTNNN